MKYRIFQFIETSFMGGTVDTGARKLFTYDFLKMMYPSKTEGEFKEFERISNKPIRQSEINKDGVYLPVERYVYPDRSLMGRFFVRLPKGSKGKYIYMEVKEV